MSRLEFALANTLEKVVARFAPRHVLACGPRSAEAAERLAALGACAAVFDPAAEQQCELLFAAEWGEQCGQAAQKYPEALVVTPDPSAAPRGYSAAELGEPAEYRVFIKDGAQNPLLQGYYARRVAELRQSSLALAQQLDAQREASLAETQKLRRTFETTYRQSRNLARKVKALKSSTSWRVSRPVRAISAFSQTLKQTPFFSFLLRPAAARRRRAQERFVKKHCPGHSLNALAMLPFEALREQLERPIAGPKISLLTAMFNTPSEFLVEMLDSVVNQTYKNWELCLVDASTQPNAENDRIVARYTEKFPNIAYKKLGQNRGISGNLNEALALATGSYLAVLDHDDMLAPNAAYEMAKAVNETGADFIYSDELLFERSLDNIKNYILKPDFSPDLFRATNYICHFAAFSRAVFQKVGLFRPETDGAQDYDYFLRVFAETDNIAHIPKVLYYWRVHALSTAAGLGVKPYAAAAARRALAAHLDAVGPDYESIDDLPNHRGYFRVNYKIQGNPRVAVVLYGDSAAATLGCYHSAAANTAWPNLTFGVAFYGPAEEYRHLQQLLPPGIPAAFAPGDFFGALAPAIEAAGGEQIVLLSQHCRVANAEWVGEMLRFSQRGDISAVGPKLLKPDDTVFSVGQILGLAGKPAGNWLAGAYKSAAGYNNLLLVPKNVSCLSGECLMLKRELLAALDLRSGRYWNIDLCLSQLAQQRYNAFTPFARLYVMADPKPTPADRPSENYVRGKYSALYTKPDSYYNPQLSLDREWPVEVNQALLPPFTK